MVLSTASTAHTRVRPEYDRFADIYAIWTDTAASTRANLPFYVDACVAADSPVVELGVGDGRIAVEVAKRGVQVTGIDASPAMLRLCRARAERAGVGEQVRTFEADFRDFTLAEPASLITLPYHSLGHLTGLDDKQSAMRQIFSQLRPGGQFIFDDFLVTPLLLAHMRQVQLRALYRSPEGQDALLWVTSLVDESSQSLTVVTWEDLLDDEGRLASRQYRQLSLSWLQPAQTRQLLTDAGFEIDACYGNFEQAPFDSTTAQEQVWIARKPS